MSRVRSQPEGKLHRANDLDLAAFRAIAEFTYDWESWVDVKGRLVWVNAAVERITGYRPEECLSMRDYPLPLVHADDRSRIREVGASAASGDSGNHIEFRILAKDGATRWAAISYQPIVNEDGVRTGYRSSVRDIEERKQMEVRLRDALAEAEEANLAKTRFLASVSHELRTPLQSILSHAELLARANLPPNLKSYAEDMTREGEHLARLVGDLLDFSALEAGGLTVVKRAFSPALEFSHRLDSLARIASQKGIELRFELGAPDLYVESDPDRCLQVLTNLVSNAIQYTSEGRVRVCVKIREGFLITEVEDTGPGLPSGVELFEPFRRGSAASGGFGLGLAISARLCERLGGKLIAESRKGRGTRMIARLPVEVTEPVQLPRTQNASSAVVLLIDDTASSREALANAVSALGHEAIPVASLNEAMAMLDNKTPDLILLDLNMPGPDFTEKARALRARIGSEPRLLVMSAGGIFTDASALSDAGINAFVQKPISLELLARLLGQSSGMTPKPIATMSDAWSASRLAELGGFRGADGRTLGERIAQRLDGDAHALSERIQEAALRGKTKALGDPLHELLGLAALLGATRAQARVRELEELANDDQPVALQEIQDILEAMRRGFLEYFPLRS